MIDFYTWPTPNGQKIAIALEELGLEYTPKAVDITNGEQFEPQFLRISPNNKIPAIVDRSTTPHVAVFESGAVLIYLAERAGRLLPSSGQQRYACLQWLQFQIAGVGPMFGQAGHFLIFAKERNDSAIERYSKEAGRLLRVLDRQLQDQVYVAADQYTIADIALLPWVRRAPRYGLALEEHNNVARWLSALEARPAVKNGLSLFQEKAGTTVTDREREFLFGDTQFQTKGAETDVTGT